MRYGLIAALVCSITLIASAWTSSEETFLGNYGEMVFRPDSLTLCIVTTEGDTVVFADTPVDMRGGDSWHIYSVISYVQEQDYYYWVIQIDGYESIKWYLVSSENGRIYPTISNADPSPDGHRLLFSNYDDAEFRAEGIEIWRIDTDSLALEFSDLDVPWDPYHVNWESDSAVVFEKTTWDWGIPEMTTLPGRLELSGDGIWETDDPESWE
ncbi:MAG: hypothetical protein KAR44_02940 [Candidatus Aegiribacteria sp.]|nr:hypothetical protein [Candidatus Aegiribacteria sp.]